MRAPWPPLPGVPALLALALLVLAACDPRPQAQGGEAAALRERVERLEREAAEDRARLAQDIAAMREDMRELRLSLEEASRNLAAASGQPDRPSDRQPGKPAAGAEAPGQDAGASGKSPRQALRDSLRAMLDVSREALGRLNQELDRQLARARRQDAPAK